MTRPTSSPTASRLHRPWLAILGLGVLSACGGGGEAEVPEDPILPPAQDALDLILPEGATQDAGTIDFELVFGELEADLDSLLVELNGVAQSGPFDFEPGVVRGVVIAETAGENSLVTHLAVRTPGATEFTPLTATVGFEILVPMASPSVGFELLDSFLGTGAFHSLGAAFSLIEDLDGDGVGDLALSSPGASPTSPRSGLVELRSGATGEVIRSLSGNEQSGFGVTLLVVPDRDNDGLDDLLIGSPADSTEFEEGGGVGVYSSATGAPLFAYYGSAPRERIGASLALLGDVNGDGIADFASGAPRAETPAGGNSGTVIVFSGLDGNILWRRDGAIASIQFGVSLSCLDDLDGDGATDLAVGVWGDIEMGPSSGSTYFLSGADGSTIRKVLGYVEDDHLGLSLLTVEDQDGDGLCDLLIGAPEAFDAAGIETGTIRLVSAASGEELAIYSGTETEERLGQSLGMLSDLNGDGVREWGLGAPFYGSGIGRVYVHDGVDGERLGILTGPDAVGLFGVSMAPFTDLDGNGLDEFLIGSTFEAVDQQPSGAMRIFSPSPLALLTAGDPTPEVLAEGRLYLGDADVLSGIFDPALFGRPYELRLVGGPSSELLGAGVISAEILTWPLPDGLEQASDLLETLEPGAALQLEIGGALPVRSNALTRDSR